MIGFLCLKLGEYKGEINYAVIILLFNFAAIKWN